MDRCMEGWVDDWISVCELGRKEEGTYSLQKGKTLQIRLKPSLMIYFPISFCPRPQWKPGLFPCTSTCKYASVRTIWRWFMFSVFCFTTCASRPVIDVSSYSPVLLSLTAADSSIVWVYPTASLFSSLLMNI